MKPGAGDESRNKIDFLKWVGDADRRSDGCLHRVETSRSLTRQSCLPSRAAHVAVVARTLARSRRIGRATAAHRRGVELSTASAANGYRRVTSASCVSCPYWRRFALSIANVTMICTHRLTAKNSYLPSRANDQTTPPLGCRGPGEVPHRNRGVGPDHRRWPAARSFDAGCGGPGAGKTLMGIEFLARGSPISVKPACSFDSRSAPTS